MNLEAQTKPHMGFSPRWQRLRTAWFPAWVILRREIKDTLRDWRIVVPIVILVIGFPFLANFAAARGLAFVNQYGAALIMERLLPFLMLAVGFFPSSFSLVIALETFVGEKERRSLESLLATPLTDLQLYTGKLLAATIPPVLGSYLGMVTYLLLMGFTLNWWPPLSLLLVSMTLSTTQSLVMVSGAVIVSCQSTSVRAANLLASFIIIPMAFLLQAEAGLLLFADFTMLWLIALCLVIVNVLLIRLGIRLFNREHLLGREIDELNLRRGLGVFWKATWPRDGLKALYTREIPDIIRGMRPELLITVLVILVGGIGAGVWGVWNFPLPIEAFSLAEIQSLETIGSMVTQSGLLTSFTPWAIFFNNARSLFVAALLALISMGILALLLLLAPVAIIVYIVAQIGGIGFNPWLFLAVTVLPHGIVEVPAAILATAQAMRMGDVMLSPPEEGGGVDGILREIGRFVKLFMSVVLPLLLLAAFIEAWITPRLLLNFLGR
jgi:uncharacterized membrane protein SpoIIM required for sporulation/ABC-type transport system involved in multi-copper enzyme maturation permease subunit